MTTLARNSGECVFWSKGKRYSDQFNADNMKFCYIADDDNLVVDDIVLCHRHVFCFDGH